MEYIRITKENIDLEHKHTAASMAKKRNKNRQFRTETVGGIAIQDYYVIAQRDRGNLYLLCYCANNAKTH